MDALGLAASTRPVMPEEPLVVESVPLVLRYRGEKMHRIETAALGDAGPAAVVTVPVDRGRLLWSPLPVELAEEVEPTAALYLAALKAADMGPAVDTAVDSGVLIHQARYRDAVLYTLLAERPRGGSVAFADNAAGISVTADLRGGGASLVLVDRAKGTVVADYPPGCATARRR
jgi:hypothetical protein